MSGDGLSVRGLKLWRVSGGNDYYVEKLYQRGSLQNKDWSYYRDKHTGTISTNDWYFTYTAFNPYGLPEFDPEEIDFVPGDGKIFTYDYRTRRVELVTSTVSTKYIFSGGSSVRELNNGVGTVDYVRGSDWGGGVGGILYSVRAGVPSFTHYNRRGDVTAKPTPPAT